MERIINQTADYNQIVSKNGKGMKFFFGREKNRKRLFDKLSETHQVQLIKTMYEKETYEFGNMIIDVRLEDLYMIEDICKFIALLNFEKYPIVTVKTLVKIFFFCMDEMLSYKSTDLSELHVELYGIFVEKIIHFSTELSQTCLGYLEFIEAIENYLAEYDCEEFFQFVSRIATNFQNSPNTLYGYQLLLFNESNDLIQKHFVMGLNKC